jgi:hypothetical protein
MTGQTGGWKQIFNAFAIRYLDRIRATLTMTAATTFSDFRTIPFGSSRSCLTVVVRTTRGPQVSEPSNSVIDRWLNEGGHDVSDHSRSDLVTRIATAEQSELAVMWPRVVREWGDDASSLWQEALSASDASET